MTDARKKMVDRMNLIYGFEDPMTIEFARLCETDYHTDEFLEMIVKSHEEVMMK